MDSGNSGSMQSSGGEEDYDPRAAANSSFNPIYNHLPPPPPTIYDPTANISNFYNPPPQLQHQQITNPFFPPQSQTISFHPQNLKQNETTRVILSPSSSQQPSQKIDQDETTQTRNPKKRSRASRRVPTTILTTDTTNFRAMVQEFTGIPAPPFTQSSPYPRSRVELFSTPSSIRSNINITQTPSPYHTLLLRPLPHKLHPPQSPLLFPNNSELGLLKNHQLQNPNQSNIFLHSSLPNSSIFGSKTEHDFLLGIPSSQSSLKRGALGEFGLSYGEVNNAQVTGLPDLISPENGNNFMRNVKQIINHPATNYNDGKTTTNNVSGSAARGTCEDMMEPWICSSD